MPVFLLCSTIELRSAPSWGPNGSGRTPLKIFWRFKSLKEFSFRLVLLLTETKSELRLFPSVSDKISRLLIWLNSRMKRERILKKVPYKMFELWTAMIERKEELLVTRLKKTIFLWSQLAIQSTIWKFWKFFWQYLVPKIKVYYNVRKKPPVQLWGR